MQLGDLRISLLGRMDESIWGRPGKNGNQRVPVDARISLFGKLQEQSISNGGKTKRDPERRERERMQRLTHERNNGIKSGYWSPEKKEVLVQRLADRPEGSGE